MRRVRTRAPIGPMTLVVAGIVAALGVLLVTDSWTLYAVVGGVAALASMVWLVLQALPARREVMRAVERGEPMPLVETDWPRWALRVGRAYLFLMTALGALLFIFLIVAAVLIALDRP